METTANTPKALLSVDVFMATSGLGRTKTYELIGSGDLETVKVGKRRLIPAEALQDYRLGQWRDRGEVPCAAPQSRACQALPLSHQHRPHGAPPPLGGGPERAAETAARLAYKIRQFSVFGLSAGVRG